MDFIRGITPDSKAGRWLLGIMTLGASEIARATEKVTEIFGKQIWERLQPNPHERPFKPAVEPRSKEIGGLVSRNASISSLCEVWTTREKEWLLDSWNIRPAGYNSEIHERQLKSSGLITISNEYPISSGGFHRYDAESGADKLVGKGALLTHIDVNIGASTLDVYSTHLNAGDLSVKLMQFIELILFIEHTRVRNNPAILVGDFNLNAYDEGIFSLQSVFSTGAGPGAFWEALRLGGGVGRGEFIEAVNRLSPQLRAFVSEFRGTINQFMEGVINLMGFKDLWKHRNELSSIENKGYGYTTDLIHAETADDVCPIRSGSELGICEELLSSPVGATRIDYMFVSSSNSGQSFTLDFTRPKRFRADRATDAPDYTEIAFMSDHLGLITNMLIVPR